MADDDDTQPDPNPKPDDDDEEDQRAWERLSPRLRGLIREELEEHEKRRTPPPPPAKEPKTEPEKEPKTEPEKPKDDSSSTSQRTRRTAADVWFGRRAS